MHKRRKMFLVHICIAVAREQLLKLQDLYTFCKFQSRLYFGPNLIYLSESFLTEDLAQIAASQQHRHWATLVQLQSQSTSLYTIQNTVYNYIYSRKPVIKQVFPTMNYGFPSELTHKKRITVQYIQIRL
jgi:hypothetical protein